MTLQSLDQAVSVLAPARLFIARIFGDVDMNTNAGFGGKISDSFKRAIAQRERRVRPNQRRESSIAPGGAFGYVTSILFDALPGTVVAMPVSRLIAEHAA